MTCQFVQILVQTSSSIACLTTQEPWVIDSGATDHMIGTPSLLSNHENPTSLPCVLYVGKWLYHYSFLVWVTSESWLNVGVSNIREV